VLIVDTDTLSIWQEGRGPAYERLRGRIEVCGQPLAITIVTVEEQMRGWLAYSAKAKTPEQQVAAYTRLREFLADIRDRIVLDFDDRAAVEFRRLKAAKVRVSTMDLRIAAIALAHDATLVTRNLTHFRRVPGLRAEDWAA
jgi:tRNA(fMet)-specific endonuclease VapC